ncbi:hypothetical protein N7489_001760 [Penicillium chrysogenum]|nr:uncharacterized protein N7489_001760 [Penicillium chrysogenum]KAJ5251350.1 hypothetical protein N7489_001760 [Penicillium chrysogenum]KAJ5262783.1 hypothetical protein N7524_008088 [Penicillium chrysogenum]KAJ6147006.1 hypothetical protein N7497_008988 [Penicillium chrysogenum]
MSLWKGCLGCLGMVLMARVGLNRVTIPDFLTHFPTVRPLYRRIMKLAWNGYKSRRPAASGTGAHDVEDYLHGIRFTSGQPLVRLCLDGVPCCFGLKAFDWY